MDPEEVGLRFCGFRRPSPIPHSVMAVRGQELLHAGKLAELRATDDGVERAVAPRTNAVSNSARRIGKTGHEPCQPLVRQGRRMR